jgi:hypothetical protein
VRRIVSAALLGVAVAGCGVGSSGNSTATTTPTPATNAVDAATARLAADALVSRGDVGAAWVQHAPPKGPSAPAPDDCAQRPDGPLANLGPGASSVGASLWLMGSRDVVLYSSSLVFADDAGVEAYLAIRNSSQWHDCRREQLQTGQQRRYPRSSVVTTRQTIAAIGAAHLVAYSEFTVMSRASKRLPAVALATATESEYRFGRVIVSIGVDVTSKTDVAPAVRSATTAALRRIVARIGSG